MGKQSIPTAGLSPASPTALWAADHRLSPTLERLDPPVDVLELGIPVGVIAPLDRLAVGLEAIAKSVQESIDRPLAGTMPLRREFGRQLGSAFARPPQGRHRVATGARIDQDLQGTEKLRGVFGQGFPTSTGPPDSFGDFLVGGEGRVEFMEGRLDDEARQAGGFRDTGDAAPSDRTSLGGCPEPACPLIEHRLQCRVLLGDDFNIGMEHSDYCNSTHYNWIGYFGEPPKTLPTECRL